jgi:hypothetical protein
MINEADKAADSARPQVTSISATDKAGDSAFFKVP